MRVLQSFPEGRATTNPYLLQLSQSLQRHVKVEGFSWRAALLGQYDVFHVHWPEILLQGRTPLRGLARRVLFRLFLARLRLRHTAVVRTVHNVRSHETLSRRDARLLERFDHQTTLWIRLNPFTPLPATALPSTVSPSTVLARTILHGDYCQWFSAGTLGVAIPTEAVPGRLLYFGLLRPYKGVDTLIDCFGQLDHVLPAGAKPSLQIMGKPQTLDLARRLQLAAKNDPRINLVLRYAGDVELATAINEAELVVLPYAEMHNSGAALLALSLNRPILVPRNVVTAALADEVGTGWVLTYEGPLTAGALAEAHARTHQEYRSATPDLSQRQWARAAIDHVHAYDLAIEAAHAH